MSSPKLQPDDPTLQAWIDHRLDPAREAEVDELLATDPVLRAYATQARRHNALLAEAFAPLLDEPVPERLRQAALGIAARADPPETASPSGSPVAAERISAALGHAAVGPAAVGPVNRSAGAANRGRWQLAAAVVLAAAIGFAAGWGGRERTLLADNGSKTTEGISLRRAAAVAHVAYAPEVRHPVEVAASDQAHLVAWLSKRLGTRLRVPDLSAQGYSLVGGRLLPDATGAVAAQFMFERSQGTRLTLFVRRDVQGNDTAFRFAQDGSLSTFYWIDRGYGYALSGDQPRESMLTLADSVYRQLNP
ncbi:MAG TPA: anti-sigma factor [Burkholderiaceae bacterium]|nr:anti-sigma factor [Burkholderiaceae bacterium]